jgi:hypothetical protein
MKTNNEGAKHMKRILLGLVFLLTAFNAFAIDNSSADVIMVPANYQGEWIGTPGQFGTMDATITSSTITLMTKNNEESNSLIFDLNTMTMTDGKQVRPFEVEVSAKGLIFKDNQYGGTFVLSLKDEKNMIFGILADGIMMAYEMVKK